MPIAKGPIEARTWTQDFEAFAIDPTGTRVHGYDVESDLARHYRFSDVVLLALTGELPDDATSRAFEIILCFLLPISITRAPAHATILAGHCSGPASGVLATASATLADDVMDLLALDPRTFDPSEAPLPDALLSSSPEESASVDRLREQLEGLVTVPLLARRPNRELALIAGLRACGISTSLGLSSVFTMARIPSVIAEATPRGLTELLQKYPMTIPTFVYEE